MSSGEEQIYTENDNVGDEVLEEVSDNISDFSGELDTDAPSGACEDEDEDEDIHTKDDLFKPFSSLKNISEDQVQSLFSGTMGNMLKKISAITKDNPDSDNNEYFSMMGNIYADTMKEALEKAKDIESEGKVKEQNILVDQFGDHDEYLGRKYIDPMIAAQNGSNMIPVVGTTDQYGKPLMMQNNYIPPEGMISTEPIKGSGLFLSDEEQLDKLIESATAHNCYNCGGNHNIGLNLIRLMLDDKNNRMNVDCIGNMSSLHGRKTIEPDEYTEKLLELFKEIRQKLIDEDRDEFIIDSNNYEQVRSLLLFCRKYECTSKPTAEEFLDTLDKELQLDGYVMLITFEADYRFMVRNRTLKGDKPCMAIEYFKDLNKPADVTDLKEEFKHNQEELIGQKNGFLNDCIAEFEKRFIAETHRMKRSGRATGYSSLSFLSASKSSSLHYSQPISYPRHIKKYPRLYDLLMTDFDRFSSGTEHPYTKYIQLEWAPKILEHFEKYEEDGYTVVFDSINGTPHADAMMTTNYFRLKISVDVETALEAETPPIPILKCDGEHDKCSTCYHNKKNVALKCGHLLCPECCKYEKAKVCPMCKAPNEEKHHRRVYI